MLNCDPVFWKSSYFNFLIYRNKLAPPLLHMEGILNKKNMYLLIYWPLTQSLFQQAPGFGFIEGNLGS
jgi:hypothetical protein